MSKLQSKKNNLRRRALLNRFLITVFLLSIVRLGNFISVPFIDQETYANLLASNNSSKTALASVLSTFSSSESNSFGLLSLGIFPYINASIVLQLLTSAVPSLERLKKEEGEYGRRKITEYTRYLTVVWAIVQSVGVTYSFRSVVFDWNLMVALQISLSLVTGSIIILWFGEIITRRGLGNGSGLLIGFSIVASLPEQINNLIIALSNRDFTTIIITVCAVLTTFIFITISCIFANEGNIRVPILSARQLMRKQITGEREVKNQSALPLRVNQAGVMPLIFTSSVMVILSTCGKFIGNILLTLPIFVSFTGFENTNLAIVFNKSVFWLTYGVLIFFFTYFYATLMIDPKDVTEQLRKSSSIIQGIQPGESTKICLNNYIIQLTTVSSIFLIVTISVLQIVQSILQIDTFTSRGFGLTSQLILVNVIIDTIRRSVSLGIEDNIANKESET